MCMGRDLNHWISKDWLFSMRTRKTKIDRSAAKAIADRAMPPFFIQLPLLVIKLGR